MKDELKVFENRRDDWLAKERKYEATISAWDFDEGRKLKVEHNENCEAEYIKETHHKKHELYNNTHNKGVANNNEQFQNVDQLKFIRIFIPIILVIFFAGLFFAFVEDGIIEIDGFNYAIPIIIFIILVNLIPNNKRRNK